MMSKVRDEEEWTRLAVETEANSSLRFRPVTVTDEAVAMPARPGAVVSGSDSRNGQRYHRKGNGGGGGGEC
jgi:hypothetical protein